MDDCANCEFLEKCREGEKIPCPWETVENVYNPNIWKIFREAYKMFVVYSAAGVPCYRTSDEAEADYRSYCVGGYYVYEA